MLFFFGSATAFESEAGYLLDTKGVIIDIADVPFIDLTAIFVLKDLIRKLKENGSKIIIVAKDKDKQQLLRLNKNNTFDDIEFFQKIDEAIKKI